MNIEVHPREGLKNYLFLKKKFVVLLYHIDVTMSVLHRVMPMGDVKQEKRLNQILV